MFGQSTRKMLLAAAVATGLLALIALRLRNAHAAPDDEHVSNFHLEEIPFNGRQAFEYLKQLSQSARAPAARTAWWFSNA